MITTINVESCLPKIGKSGKPFFKLNNKFFIWEKEIGRTFEDNIGKNYEVEIVEGDFPKVIKILSEVNDKIERKPIKIEAKKEENLEEALDKEKIKAKIIVLLGQL